MRLIGLKNCDTCRKALKMLAEAGHEVDYLDVRADGVDPADLDRFIAAFGDKLMNTRSTTWRGLDDTERARPMRDLLIEHPTLMKRPVVEAGDQLFLGWTKDVQAALLT